jgi:hypothetical protein
MQLGVVLALTRAADLDVIGSSSAPTGERSVWNKIWKLPVLPKVQNFIWKMVKNELPTNIGNCFSRHVARDALCEICYNPCEDCYDVPSCNNTEGGHEGALVTTSGRRPAQCPWFLLVLESNKLEEVGNLATILWHA